MSPKAKILLIDDDFLVLRSLAHVLDKHGYATTAVNSGARAIERVGKEDYDLVMSDIRMPELDGVETMEIIGEHCKHHGKTCSFMFITGYPDDQRAKEIVNSGRFKLMPKPFDIEDLLASIDLELQMHPSSPRTDMNNSNRQRRRL